MTATRRQPRAMRIAETVFPRKWLKLIVTVGRTVTGYRVVVEGATVGWDCLSDTTRTSRVTIGEDGRSLCCNCKGATLGRAMCRHMAATDELIKRRLLTVQDELETISDLTANAEELDAYYS
jgi:hypothetical protein